MFFVKKNKKPNLHYLLDEEFARAKAEGKNIFYHLVQEKEINCAHDWCIKNKVTMNISYMTDRNTIFEFKFYNEKE